MRPAKLFVVVAFIIQFTSVGFAESINSEFNVSQMLAYAQKFFQSADDENKEDATKPSPTPAQIWISLESSAWPDTLRAFQAKFYVGKSYIALFEKIPVNPLDMRSANRFKNSTIRTELNNTTSIGHMSVGWSCAQGENRNEGFVAQTGEAGQSLRMLKDGWGITSVIATFNDGYMQNGFDIQRYFSNDLIDRNEQKLPRHHFFALVVEVPNSECQKVRGFVKSYVLHPSQPYKHFGMIPDPLKFEGAGCGSFAVSALSQANSIYEITTAFWRTISLPEKLFGIRQKELLPKDVEPLFVSQNKSQDRPVYKLDLFRKNWDSGKIKMNLRLVDPELTIFAFREFGEWAARSTIASQYQITNLEATKRIYHFADQGNENTNFDNHDSGWQEISSTFDPSFAKVSMAIKSYWSSRASISTIELVSFQFGVGVLINSAP